MRRRDVGRLGEELAARHVERAGWTIHDRNWRCRHGELDIVCRDGSMWVFVEVRTLRGSRTGRPEESIRETKRCAVIRTSLAWLQRHGGTEQSFRFDVIAVRLDGPEPSLRHIRGAFDGTGEAL
ncbi:MAG: YraN family protein [Deltaproteobacteria bacterium]|nr:YraN family protein [Deltaproteobacteria bacterium]